MIPLRARKLRRRTVREPCTTAQHSVKVKHKKKSIQPVFKRAETIALENQSQCLFWFRVSRKYQYKHGKLSTVSSCLLNMGHFKYGPHKMQ